jgi:hypothetical protein
LNKMKPRMGEGMNAVPGEIPEWETENDVRTLANAHKIMGDKARHGRAKEHAKKKLAEMQKVVDGDNGDRR